MIRQAVLYLATAQDLHAALRPVVGRPVAFRALLAAVRAGMERVGVPGVFRGTALEAAIAASPRARDVAIWLDATALAPSATVLVPAAALAPPGAVTAVAAAGPGAVLDASAEDDAPLVAVDDDALAALADALRQGSPIGESLRRRREAPFGRRVAPDAWYARVGDAASAAAAEDALFATLGSPIDTRLDRVLHRPLSRHVTRAAIALGVTPNQVSVASLLVGLGAVASFWNAGAGGALLGLLLYLAAVVLDHADGEVARLRLAESALGEWLDILVDTAVHAGLVVALGVTTNTLTGAGVALGIVAAAGVVASALAAKLWPVGSPDDSVGGALENLGSRDGFYALLVLFIATRALAPAALPALMLVVALGSHGYWLARAAYTLGHAWRRRGSGVSVP